MLSSIVSLLSCLGVLCHAFSCTILSFSVYDIALSCRVVCLVLVHVVLYWFVALLSRVAWPRCLLHWFVLSCIVMYCLVLYCFVMCCYCHGLSTLYLSCLIVFFLVLSCLVLSLYCLVLS